MITVRKIIIYSVVFSQITFTPFSVYCERQENFLSPVSFFSQQFRDDLDALKFVTQAFKLLSGKLSDTDFKKELAKDGIENLTYRLEQVSGKIEAIRFKANNGDWYRLGKNKLGKSDPELGFLIPEKTEHITNFWLEGFERTINVNILNHGIAIGTVVKIDPAYDFEHHVDQESSNVDVEAEKAALLRMKDAVLASYNDKLQKTKGTMHDLLDTHRMITEFEIDNSIMDLISPTVTAQEAIKRHFSKAVGNFLTNKATKFIDLAKDMADIAQTMLDELDGINRLTLLEEKISLYAGRDEKVVLVGRILPIHYSLNHFNNVVGIVTDELHFPDSHSVVLAQGAGIPFAMNSGQIPSIEKDVADGETVALELQDSDRSGGSLLTLNPEPSHRMRMIRQTNVSALIKEGISSIKSATRDGHPIRLQLNVSVHEDFPWKKNVSVHKNSPEEKNEYTQLGLVRSDFTYLQRDSAPSLEDLSNEYERFFSRAIAAGVKEISFRTFDIDPVDPYKNPAYFTNDKKLEGIDFALHDPEGLEAQKIQIRSLFIGLQRAQVKGQPIKLKILFPKVNTLEEYREASNLVQEIHEELKREDDKYEHIEPLIGIMVETKEALEHIQDFMGQVDFINVGTNDLTLSLFPDKVARVITKEHSDKVPLANYYHKVLGPLETIIKAAANYPDKRKQPPICVCGNLASYPQYALHLLGLGYPKLSLSMTHNKVLDLKLNIAAHDYDEIREYAREVSVYQAQALAASADEKDRAYLRLKEFLSSSRSEMEQDTLNYVYYEWVMRKQSDKRLFYIHDVLDQINKLIESFNSDEFRNNFKKQRIALAQKLMDLDVLPSHIFEKSIDKGWDLKELYTVLEVWAYQTLINQGTFFVYRAKKVGNDYWLRVLPTGDEFRWKSRYERRIKKDPDETVWIETGPHQRLPATRVSFPDEPDAEIYSYIENGQEFFARKFDVDGVPFTYVKSNTEKDYVIKLFQQGETSSAEGAQETFYRDNDGKTQLIHVPDSRKHPVFKDLPYDKNKPTNSILFFLLSENPDKGEITWGQNMAKPGYGHLFEDNGRILDLLINKLRIIDVSIKSGRQELRRLKSLIEIEKTTHANFAFQARVAALEKLLEKLGIHPDIISDPRLIEEAA